MPAIVLIGAQWGDEGKGKATDLLGDRVQYVVRYQGGNNAGHTVVIGEEKYALHVLPVRRAVPERHACHRQRRRHRPEGAVRGDRRARGPRRELRPAAHQRQRAPDHALPPGAGQGQRAVPRQRQDRHHRPGHRADLRRQDRPGRHPGPGPVRPGHPRAEARARPAGQEPAAHQGLQPARRRRQADRRRLPGLRRADAALRRRHRPGARQGARRRRDRAARGRPGVAARHRPRHLSVRHLVQPDRGRRLRRVGHRADSDHQGDRHRQGVHHAGRVGPVPHRAQGRVRRVPAQDRRRVRRDHRPGAPHAAGSTR